MRRASFWLVFFIGTIIGVTASQITHNSLKALPPKGDKTGPCQCGCIATGKCDCPNCAVGCGFLPAEKK